MLDKHLAKQNETHQNSVKTLSDMLKQKEKEYVEMRRTMLEEIVYLRDRVYSKHNVEVFRNEDIFRLEAFKVEDVVEPQYAKLMNDRMERMREFYLTK
jgi:hypothetical protein